MKKLVFGSAMMSCLSMTGVAHAAAPMAFGQWASQGGTVSASCPSGTACETVAESSGFFQQNILDNEGNIAQIHTIIMDKGLTGNADTLPFSTENFVQRNDPADSTPDTGLASRQILSNDTANNFDGSDVQFSMSNITESGWAAEVGKPNITNEQFLSETGGKFNAEFSTSFLFEANLNEVGIMTGSSLRVDQEFVQITGSRDQSASGGDCDNGCPRNAQEALGFALGITAGDMTPSGSATLNGVTVSWNPGDTVAAKWVGQSNNHWQELEDFSDNEYMPGFEALKEEYLAFENRTTDQVTRFFQFGGDINPAVWLEGQFGSRPSMPAYTAGRNMPSNDSDNRTSGGIQRLPNTVNAQYAFQFEDVPLDVSDPAGSPIDFSAWSVADGAISANCPVGMSCSGTQGGVGFLQQFVSNNSDGQEYIRTILTDSDASGSAGSLPYSSETLVALRGDDGIINLQLVDGGGASGNTNGYSDRSVVRSGWAVSSGLPSVEFTQRIASKIPQQGFTWDHLFEYKANIDGSNGSPTGFTMNIEQISEDSYSLIPQKTNAGRRDDWMFVRREVAGDMLTSSGTLGGNGDGDESGGGRVSYSPGDDIKITWFGQIFAWEEEGRSEDTVNFYYQGYDNVSDNQAGSYEADREDGPGPRGWNAVFGARPTYPFGRGRSD